MSEADMEKGDNVQILFAEFFKIVDYRRLLTIIVEGNLINWENFFSDIKYLAYL